MNPQSLPRKRPLKFPRLLPLQECEFSPRFCEKNPSGSVVYDFSENR